MARKQRQKATSGIYHVMLRGINKQDIFIDDDDKMTMQRVLGDAHCKRSRLGKVLTENECDVYAYCIMPNHVHILLKEKDSTLSEIMKKIEDRFVFFYNTKYDRCGHLFQDRFRSEPVDSELYFKQLVRYIHRNPVKGMLCPKLEDYPYSSWLEYADSGREAIINVCNKTLVESYYTPAELTNWVNMDVDDQCMDMDTERFVLTDKHAWEILSDISGEKSPEDFKLLSPDIQLSYIKEAINSGISMRQASRLSIFSDKKIKSSLIRKTSQGVRPLAEIFESIKANPSISLSEISSQTEISLYSCRKLLQSLVKQGYIEPSGSQRCRSYKILKDLKDV